MDNLVIPVDSEVIQSQKRESISNMGLRDASASKNFNTSVVVCL